MGSAPQANLFSLLPRTRTPLREFALSFAAHAAIFACVISFGFLHPIASPTHPSLVATRLVPTPISLNLHPQPAKLDPVPLPLPIAPVHEAVFRLPQSPRARVSVQTISVPAVTLAGKIDPLPVVPPMIPRALPKSEGSSAAPTRAQAKVQMGGFGDPNGIPAKANPTRPINIAAGGSFDLPSAAGHGNGSSAKGVAGVVPSAGFGDSAAVSPSARSAGAAVHEAGFASAAAPLSSGRSSPAERPAIQIMPAEILSKPAPLYTREARNLRIEGEVLLEVVLHASGDLQVLRLVRGLGHGLDDNAVKAAEKIRFKPAMKDGQPADSTVVLHVIFQLA